MTDQEIPSDYRLEFLKPIVLRSQHLAVLSQTAVAKPPEPDSESAVTPAAVSKKLALEGRISCRAECRTAQTGSNEVYMKVVGHIYIVELTATLFVTAVRRS